MEMIIDFIYKLFKFKNDQYSANYILFKNFFTTRYIDVFFKIKIKKCILFYGIFEIKLRSYIYQKV